MKQRAALGSTGIADHRFERQQAENASCIDRIGVAAQSLDLGHREVGGPHAERRLRLRPWRETLPLTGIERARPGQQFVAAPAQCGRRVLADEGEDALQPARRHRRRVAGAGGARQHHLLRAHRHLEIMGGKADAAFRRLEVDAGLHQPRHEAIAFRLARPHAFVQPADDQRVDVLQPRFQRAPDGDVAVGALPRLDRFRRNQRVHHIGPFVGGDVERRRGRDHAAQQLGEFLSGVAGIEPGEVAIRRAAEIFQRGDAGPGQRDKVGFAFAAKHSERRQRRRQPAQKFAGLLDAAYAEAREPEGLALVAAQAGKTLLEQCRQRCDVGSPGAAAQRHQFDDPGGMADAGAFQAEFEQRMLEQRQQADRIAGPEYGLQHQPQQAGRRRVGERRAAGIVGDDAEAQQLGRDTPRQRPVAGDECGPLPRLFDRGLERDGDRHRLVAFAGGFDQRHIGEGLGDVARH